MKFIIINPSRCDEYLIRLIPDCSAEIKITVSFLFFFFYYNVTGVICYVTVSPSERESLSTFTSIYLIRIFAIAQFLSVAKLFIKNFSNHRLWKWCHSVTSSKISFTRFFFFSSFFLRVCTTGCDNSVLIIYHEEC